MSECWISIYITFTRIPYTIILGIDGNKKPQQKYEVKQKQRRSQKLSVVTDKKVFKKEKHLPIILMCNFPMLPIYLNLCNYSYLHLKKCLPFSTSIRHNLFIFDNKTCYYLLFSSFNTGQSPNLQVVN